MNPATEVSACTPAATFMIYSRKDEAAYVTRRLRDHGVIAGMRGGRGDYEVFGFVPDRLGICGVRHLMNQILWNRHGRKK
jgi:hypothetical protein